MKEKKKPGHDDRISLQAAIAKGLAHCCSGCPESQRCTDRKRYYDCVDANALPIRNRHAPRVYKGISDEAIAKVDSIVSEGVLKGQSLHHIFESDASLKAICCERTARRHVYAGYLSVKAHQLPRCVRFSHKYGYSERKTAMYAKKAGVKVIKLHEFRHSCVSNLLASGLSVRVIAHWVGDTERTVQDTYSHLLPSDKGVIKDFFDAMSSPAATNPLPDGD